MSNVQEIARFTKKITDSATILQKTQREAVGAAALATKTAFLAAPGAPKMVAKKKAGVRYDVKGEQNPTALVKWFGPVHLVNNPTKPHEIQPKKFTKKGSSFTGRGGLKLADGSIRRSVHHPGTKGKHFFEKSRTVAEKVAPDVYARTNQLALAKHFAGG